MPTLEPLINGKERLAAEEGRRPAFGGQRNKVALGNKPTMVRIVTEKQSMGAQNHMSLWILLVLQLHFHISDFVEKKYSKKVWRI